MKSREEIEQFMTSAIELAKEGASMEGGPFGAIVVKEGKIIGSAYNSVTTDNDPTAHAEVNAIREACQTIGSFDLSGCLLYTSCEPCPMCLAATYWARIDKVYYAASREDAARAGFSDQEIYDQISLPIEERTLPMERLLHKEREKAFQVWDKNSNKVEY
ncbi:MAG: nucleoside deaminase [Bacteroidales bacterium]